VNTNPTQEAAAFSKKLVESALALTPDSTLENLVAFLDSSAALRSMDISEIDLQSEAAVVMFVNVYHCLLQHALLLLGPPTKHSIAHFMRCVCYEIGKDVFSLSELQYCLIRGKLSAATHNRHYIVEPSRSSVDAFKVFALGAVDARVNFVLHAGLAANPIGVYVLDPAVSLSTQLNEASTAHIQRTIVVDSKKKTVLLPEVCKIFKDDFESDNPLHYILRFLEKKEWEAVSWLLAEGVNVKYMHLSGDFSVSLKRERGGGTSAP
jgi:hypothetical protein